MAGWPARRSLARSWPRLAMALVWSAVLMTFAVGCAKRSSPPPPDLSPAGSPPSQWDIFTERALREAALGRPDALGRLAKEIRVEEAAAQKARRAHPVLSDQVRGLALTASAPPLPRARDYQRALAGSKTDESSRAIPELLKRMEPESRLAEARRIHRYQSIQQPFNTLAATGLGVLQGQLFAVVDMVVGAVESVVRYPYPTPTEREVLRARRNLLAESALAPRGPDLERQVAKGMERRRRLARLQAIENADRAIEQDNYHRSLWWLDRARQLDPKDTSLDARMAAAAAQANRITSEEEHSLTVVAGEDRMADPNERVLYAALVRAFLEDTGSEETARLRNYFLATYPASIATDAVRWTELAALHQQSRPEAARIVCEWMGRRHGNSPAGQKALLWARSPLHSAPAAFENARKTQRAEWWNYLVFGETPRRTEALFSAEEARTRRGGWLRYLRPLFVTDMLNRLLLLPFGWPLDHAPTLDAVGSWTPAPPDDPKAEARARARAEALRKDRRHAEAARAFRELNPPDHRAADVCNEKAARKRFDEAMTLQQPEQRAQALRRLLNAYPHSRIAEKAAVELEDAERRSTLILIVSPKELRARPELWDGNALALSPTLLDGNTGNGEISREGLELHLGNRAVYRDAGTGERVDLEITPTGFSATLRRLLPLRRTEKLADEQSKPGRLPRIPLQIEGTALPGIEGYPGLAPLREIPGDVLYR